MPVQIKILDESLVLESPESIHDDTTPIKDIQKEEAENYATFELTSGEYQFDSQTAVLFAGTTTSFEIEAINEDNPARAEEIDDDDPDAVQPIEVFPWSYGNAEAALVYRLAGTAAGGFDSGSIPFGGGGSVRLGLEAGSEIATSHIRIHEGSSQIGPTIEDDLKEGSNFKLALDSRQVRHLRPRSEFLMVEAQSRSAFAADFTWGQLFIRRPGLLVKLVPSGTAITAGSDFEAELVPRVSLRATFESRMQMVVSRLDSKQAEVRIYQAKERSTGISGGIRITADLLDKGTARAAVSHLIASLTGDSGERFVDSSDALNATLAKISNWRENFDLPRIPDEFLRSKADKVVSALRIGAADLFALDELLNGWKSDFARVVDAVPNLDQSISDLASAISEKLTDLTTNSLPEEYEQLANSVLGSAALEGTPIAVVGQILALPDFATRIDSQLSSVSGRLRKEILNTIGNEKLLEGLDANQIKLLRLVSEQSGISTEDLASRLATLDYIDTKIIAAPEEVASLFFSDLREALRNLSETSMFSDTDADLKAIAERLAKIYSVPLLQLPARLDQLAERIAETISEEAVASARFELSRKKTKEALFTIVFKRVDEDVSQPDLKLYFDELRNGNIDFFLERVQNGANAGKFEFKEYFAAETAERRNSVALRLLSATANSENRSVRRKIQNLETEESLLFSESICHVRDFAKRDFKNSLNLSARTVEFAPTDSISAKSFRFDFQTSFRWAGKTGSFYRSLENKRILKFLAKALDQADKKSRNAKVARDANDITTSLTQQLKPDEDTDFGFHISLDDGAFRWLCRAENFSTLHQEYYNSWHAATPHSKSLFINVDGNFDDDVSKDFFQSLGNLARAITEDNSADELSRKMRKFRKRYNAAWTKSPDHLFKICFPTALLKTLEADLPGWKVNASIRTGNSQVFFA